MAARARVAPAARLAGRVPHPAGGVAVVADSSAIGSSCALPAGADGPPADRAPSSSGLLHLYKVPAAQPS